MPDLFELVCPSIQTEINCHHCLNTNLALCLGLPDFSLKSKIIFLFIFDHLISNNQKIASEIYVMGLLNLSFKPFIFNNRFYVCFDSNYCCQFVRTGSSPCTF